MFVGDFMTRELVTIHVDEKAGQALQRMREEGLRRLPVLNDEGRLVGIITDRRLLQALAVPVRRGQLRRAAQTPPTLRVGDIMNQKCLTTSPDSTLEDAAILMVSNRVGSLVVLEADKPVGIITETDMFRVFIELLIGDEPGLRVTGRAPAFPGILSDVTTALARAGGNLLSLGNVTDEEGFFFSCKVANLTEQDVRDVLGELPVEIMDIREIK